MVKTKKKKKEVIDIITESEIEDTVKCQTCKVYYMQSEITDHLVIAHPNNVGKE